MARPRASRRRPVTYVGMTVDETTPVGETTFSASNSGVILYHDLRTHVDDSGRIYSGDLHIIYKPNARGGWSYRVTLDGELVRAKDGYCGMSTFSSLEKAAKYAGV